MDINQCNVLSHSLHCFSEIISIDFTSHVFSDFEANKLSVWPTCMPFGISPLELVSFTLWPYKAWANWVAGQPEPSSYFLAMEISGFSLEIARLVLYTVRLCCVYALCDQAYRAHPLYVSVSSGNLTFALLYFLLFLAAWVLLRHCGFWNSEQPAESPGLRL